MTNLIRHCIVDTSIGLIVNIIEYEVVKTGTPPGLESNLLCVENYENEIGDSYVDGVFIKQTDRAILTAPSTT